MANWIVLGKWEDKRHGWLLKTYLFYMYSWFACTYLCAAPACNTQGGQKRALNSPGTGVTEGCKVPHGCCELNPGLLQDQLSSPNTDH